MGENEENEEQPVLRSLNNDHSSYVRFVNRTRRDACVYWIDYQGQAVSYGVLSHGQYIDINTFVTHPWIFVDQETQDRYTVNQRDVFFPEMPRRVERKLVYITQPMFTLRELSLRAVKRRLKHDWQAFSLDIPRSLQYELALMLLKSKDGPLADRRGGDNESQRS